MIPTDPKFQENVEKQIRQVADQTEELRTKLKAEGAVVSDKLEVVLKDIFANTQTAAQNIKTQIESAIATSKKE